MGVQQPHEKDINVGIARDVSDALQRHCDADGRKKGFVATRVLRWFLAQDTSLQRLIDSDFTDEDIAQIARMILQRMARQERGGKKNGS